MRNMSRHVFRCQCVEVPNQLLARQPLFLPRLLFLPAIWTHPFPQEPFCGPVEKRTWVTALCILASCCSAFRLLIKITLALLRKSLYVNLLPRKFSGLVSSLFRTWTPQDRFVFNMLLNISYCLLVPGCNNSLRIGVGSTLGGALSAIL